jgi:nucleoid-associated protein YgaU
MPSRYARTPKIERGKAKGSSFHSPSLFFAAQNGTLNVLVRDIKGGERLDTIAADMYGDGSYWWVIAAATGIGWCLQVPPGTTLRIPRQLGEALAYAGR